MRSTYRISKNKGQALAEIAIFGAIFIFLVGMIIRTHVNTSYGQNYKVRALKMALKQSYEGYQETDTKKPHTSRNSANVLFVEDRISPDFNKYNASDRTPFIASASATMSNMLHYPVDHDEFNKNLPIQDVFINGQHFQFTTAAFVYRTLYDREFDCDSLPGTKEIKAVEKDRCVRQIHEMEGDYHTFYAMAVNGTADFQRDENIENGKKSTFNYLRNPGGEEPPDGLRDHMAWQWRKTPALGNEAAFDFGTEDNPKYASFDTSGSLQEQTIYYMSAQSKACSTVACQKCRINGNDHLISITDCPEIVGSGDPRKMANQFTGPIKAVAVLDSQLGDLDGSYTPGVSLGPQPGFSNEMSMYTNAGAGGVAYLEIHEKKLVHPQTRKFVRSINSKDRVDFISRVFQLSNDTGRMCKGVPNGIYEDGTKNPVEACGNCFVYSGPSQTIKKTCFDPSTRQLHIRAAVLDKNKREWFTEVTKGL